MSATKPDDLTLALHKVTEGFTANVDRPTDNDIIKIRQLLLPVLMKTNYEELTLTHNILGVIIPSECYEHIYKKRAYLIRTVIALSYDTIDKDATRTEVHRAEVKHEARRNDRQLYETDDNACRNSIVDVVDETWYMELEDPDTFYTNITAIKILNHLTWFCSGIHTVDALDNPQFVKTLFSDAEGITQFINAMEAVQRKSKCAKLVIPDDYMYAVALKLLLQSGEYETETREWSKLPDDKQTWSEWKTTFRAAYVAKLRSEAAREGEEKLFGRSALFGAAPEKRQDHKNTEGTPQLTNQMLELLEGYLDNIAAAATQTAANGGPLAELAASLAISVNTVVIQQKEIKCLSEKISALKKEGSISHQWGYSARGETVLFANIVKRLAERRRTGETHVTLTHVKIQTEKIGQDNSWRRRD